MPSAQAHPPKEMLVCKMDGRVEVLIPKQRGVGYLKAPLGHHMNALAELANEFGLDFQGLDGTLEIYGACMSPLTASDYSLVISKTMPAISELNGFTFRLVNRDEFYQNLLAPTKIGDTK